METTYIAKPYVAGSPEAEVTGAAMIAFLDNLRSEAVAPILKKHNADKIKEDKWYPHQLWLDILKSLEDELGGAVSEVFVAFGREVVATAVMPPEIQSVSDALNALHAIHHANLRNIPNEEGYFLDKVEDQKYIVYQNTPNPDDAIYGFLWALASRFKQEHEFFVVKPMARKEGAPYPGTPFEVRWWED